MGSGGARGTAARWGHFSPSLSACSSVHLLSATIRSYYVSILLHICLRTILSYCVCVLLSIYLTAYLSYCVPVLLRIQSFFTSTFLLRSLFAFSFAFAVAPFHAASLPSLGVLKVDLQNVPVEVAKVERVNCVFRVVLTLHNDRSGDFL